MNRGTVIYVAIALATAAGALSMRPTPPKEGVAYQDVGEVLFPEFTDPTVAASLEVAEWNEDAAKASSFRVEQKGGVWVIPSHNDYPADATQRMGEAAASFVGVKKDAYYGDNVADHAGFGVLDPNGTAGEGDERGRRFKLADESGKMLVDIIVGKSIEGKAGMYYVRFPAPEGEETLDARSKRVYGSKIDLNVTTEFADWIEKDLLHVERDEVMTVISDPYTVDEKSASVVGRNPVIATRDPNSDSASGSWTSDVSLPGKELDEVKIRQVATAIANIKIVGVRPRPKRLTLRELQSKGFFVSGSQDNPQLYGNEGQAAIITKDGLQYMLYFGEVTYESGLALTSGTKPEDGSETQAPGEEKKTASRYMWVDVSYDPGYDTTLATRGDEASPEGEVAEGDAPAAEDAEDTDAAEDEKKKLRGRERADRLADRFSQWYYVISDSSFKQIHKTRDELFKTLKTDE